MLAMQSSFRFKESNVQNEEQTSSPYGIPDQNRDDRQVSAKKVAPTISPSANNETLSNPLSNRPTNPNSLLAAQLIGHDGPLTSISDLRKYDKFLELQNRINNDMDESLNNLQVRRDELKNWDKLRDDTPKLLFYNAFGTTDAQDRTLVLRRIEGVMQANRAITIDNFRMGALEDSGMSASDYANVGAYVRPDDPYRIINIGPIFEMASLPQLLTHEISHFNGIGPVVPRSTPPLTGTVDNRIDPTTGRNTGESYGNSIALPTSDALYHADTFGFCVTGTVRAKQELNYYQYINLLGNGAKR